MSSSLSHKSGWRVKSWLTGCMSNLPIKIKNEKVDEHNIIFLLVLKHTLRD